MAHELRLQRMGQIVDARVRFGDLTVLVGPQATGKSILLQFHKLLIDQGYVLSEMKRYGLDWGKDVHRFLDTYLGEGMSGVWSDGESRISVDNSEIDLESLVGRQKRNKTEEMFFIPAQRVLAMGNGWPRPFSDFGAGDPFVVRAYSEALRSLIEKQLREGEALFPQTRRLKAEIRDALDETVFAGFRLSIDTHGVQRRLVLTEQNGAGRLPFMVWSAGQREFVPLLLGLYWLLPPTKVSRRADIEWVVIEELEMGLHPQAISAVLFLALELISRGYRVCLSTHSSHVLDVVWALNILKEMKSDPAKLLEVFDVKATPSTKKMAKKVLTTTESYVFYFDREGRTHDISKLDPGSQENAEAGWGGLTEFSGRVQDVVASVMEQSE